MTRLLALLPVALLAGAAPAGPFLAPADAARLLADGRPWTGTRSDGDHVRLTFNPDGTGRFEGPITRTIAWAIEGDAICIRLGFPLGAKCLRFQRTAAGLQAFAGEAPDLLLTR